MAIVPAPIDTALAYGTNPPPHQPIGLLWGSDTSSAFLCRRGGAINMSPDDPIAVLCRAKRKISEPWGPHAHGMMTRA